MTRTETHRAIYATAESAADEAGMGSPEWHALQSAAYNADLAVDDRDSDEWYATFAGSLSVLTEGNEQ